MPLVAVPAMLAGHCEYAPLTNDAAAEYRILWCHLQRALDRLYRGQSPRPDEVERVLHTARAFASAVGIDLPAPT